MPDLALQVEFLLSGMDDANGNDLTGGKVTTLAANTVTLTGQADQTEAFKLHDADGSFTADYVGAVVLNTTDTTQTTVTAFVDSGELTLADDIFESGENYSITAFKQTFEDFTKLTPHANPIILDAFGRRLVFADGDYKFEITDSNDNAIVTYDGLQYIRTGPVYLGTDGELRADTSSGTVQITLAGVVQCEG